MLENLIKFSVVVSLSSVLLAGSLVQAHAAVTMNGGGENGMELNGTRAKYNGDSLNGGGSNAISPNGGGTNGKEIKGNDINGKDATGVTGRLAGLAIDSIQLPTTH